MKRASYGLVLVGVLLCLTLGAGLGQATTLTFYLDYDFNNNVNPYVSPPQLKAVFDDNDVPGGPISLELFALEAMPPGSYVTEWYFNLDPGDYIGSDYMTFLAIEWAGDGARPTAIDILSGYKNKKDGYLPDQYKADGDGWYDFGFAFTDNDFFVKNQTLQFSISSTSPSLTLNLESFETKSTPGGAQGTYYSAAQVSPGQPGWVGATDYTTYNGGGTQDDPQPPPEQVPEPATLLLLGSGLVGIAAGWRRKLRS